MKPAMPPAKTAFLAQETKLRAPIAILGVPFDNLTASEAIVAIEEMIRSGQPHYLVTANVDFLVQARGDVELRRILNDAHLVLCDGTPLVWASRWLGNGLAERVAGADLVPLLVEVAARRGYRLFLLGATEESARRAVAKLCARHPSLVISGEYSPPFASLLEMDHDEIKRRVLAAKPDILLVSFGCPKQEKWLWMHYRNLGVPVCVGVGATIDFLAGKVKRAPVWMQRTGSEWIFRLAQEPRRLFKRYAKDLWVFGWGILPQIWHLQIRRIGSLNGLPPRGAVEPANGPTNPASQNVITLPASLDSAAVHNDTDRWDQLSASANDCILPMEHVKFVDSTGIGLLIKLQKKLRSRGKFLILVAPSAPVQRALKLMRLADFFCVATDLAHARQLLTQAATPQPQPNSERPANGVLEWRGEVTAATVDDVWQETSAWLALVPETASCTIDLSQVPFIDSSGLGVMVRAKKHATRLQRRIFFSGLRPPVRNVVKLAKLEEFLLTASC